MLTAVFPPFSIPYTPNITPYHFLTLIIPLLLSPAALAALAPATVFGLHKVLQSLIMFLDLILHVVNHLFLHLVELLHLLRRLQGLGLLLQQLLHLGLQVVLSTVFQLIHSLFKLFFFQLLLLDVVLKLLSFNLRLTKLIQVLSLHNLLFTAFSCIISLLSKLQLNILDVSLDLHVYPQSEFYMIRYLLTVQAQYSTVKCSI